MVTVPRLVVAGSASGVGKTTLACALIAAFRRRGLRVQPFKAGPDYIDPGHHAVAAGRPSRNLDTFLLPPAAVRELFARAARDADLAVVEGVMGLYDGRDGASEEGSTAQLAKLLGAPVVVVIDARALSRTAGAVALGLARFDPAVRVAGFVLARVGGERHARWAADAVESATGLPVLGALPRDERAAMPERHLGLVLAAEQEAAARERVALLGDLAERHLALDRILALASSASAVPGAGARATAGSGEDNAGATLFPAEPARRVARIAVARDEAFSFYYEDALDLLAAHGAELVPFSPLRDRRLPAGVGGVYLGGGYPELHAARLAEGRELREEIRARAGRDLVVYAECGGLMYLARALTDLEGRRHEMAGLLPVDVIMRGPRPTLGYRTVTALRENVLLAAGEQARGHEFHWSELAGDIPVERAAYAVAERGGAREGYADGGVLASYVHVHFASDPRMARRFVAACAQGTAAGSSAAPLPSVTARPR